MSKNSNSNIITRGFGFSEGADESILLEECRTYLVDVKPHIVPGLKEKAAQIDLEVSDMRFMLSYQKTKGEDARFGSHRLNVYIGFGDCGGNLTGIFSTPINIDGAITSDKELKDLAMQMLLDGFLYTEDSAAWILKAYCRSIGVQMYDNDEIFEMWLEEEDLTCEMLQEMEIIDLKLNIYAGENGLTTEFVYETVYGEKGEFHGFDIDYDMEEDENLTIVGLNCKVYDAMYLTLFGELPERSYIGEYAEFVYNHTILTN